MTLSCFYKTNILLVNGYFLSRYGLKLSLQTFSLTGVYLSFQSGILEFESLHIIVLMMTCINSFELSSQSSGIQQSLNNI